MTVLPTAVLQEQPHRGLMECFEGFIDNAEYLEQNNHPEQHLCLI